jgi:hypothetical protein
MSDVVNTLTEETRDGQTPSPAEQRKDAIRAGVLAALGRPAQLLKVTVVPLWDDNFRVNVWTDGDSIGISNSFFVTADQRGTILQSEPPIRKRY